MNKLILPILLLFFSGTLAAQYTVDVSVTQVGLTGFCDLDNTGNGDSDPRWRVTVFDNRDYDEDFGHEITSNGPNISISSGWDNPLNYNRTYTNICPPNFLILDFASCEADLFGVCNGEGDSNATVNMTVPMTAGTVVVPYSFNVSGCGGTITWTYELTITTTGTPAYLCSDEPCTAATQTIQDGCTTTAIFTTRYDVSNSTSNYPSSLFGCGGDNDIFFEFVAPPSGEIVVNMTEYADFGSLFELTDLTMNLMEGSSCSSLNPVDTETIVSGNSNNGPADCIDMSGGAFNGDNYSPIYLQGLTVGQTYYLRVTEDDNQNAYMDLSFQAIVENDFCQNAIELTGTDNFTACNFNATDRDEPDTDPWTGPAHTGNFVGQPVQECSIWGSNENMVWYYFTVDSNTPQPISITAESVVCEGGSETLQLGVWYQGTAAACDIAAMQGVGCAVGTDTDLTVTLPDGVPNGTYYVAMDGNAGALCVWEFTSPQILPTCPAAATATASTATDICSGSNVSIDLDFAVAGFGGATGSFDLSVSPSAGVSFSTGTTDVLAGTTTVSFAANQTCSPITYTIAADAKCTLTDGVVNDIADPMSITVTVYPEALSLVVVDDGSTCGTPTVELQAANGTACETQSGIGSPPSIAGSCANNGDALNYDFDGTPTTIALGMAPAGCSLPNFTGTVTCSGCASCSIDNIAAGNQIPCDPSTDTYDQEIIITFTDAPTSGSLVVNGETFAIGTSPQTVLLTGLSSDGNPVNVTASFSADASCSLSLNSVFTAPTTCVSCTDGVQNGQETGLDCGGPSCPACPICSVSKTYTGTTLTGIYQTSNTINSYAEVPSGEDVSLLAACINLYDGFEVKLGAEFLADPVPCIPLTNGGSTSLQEEEQFIMAQDNKDIRVSFYLNNITNVDLSIKSADGSFEDILIPHQEQLAGEHLVQIDASPLKAGVYFLVFKTNKGERVEKLIIH